MYDRMILKNPITRLGLAALLLACTAGHVAAADPLFADPVVVKARDFEIKASDLEAAYIKYQSNLAANNQVIPGPQREEIERRILDRLVVMRIVAARATAEDRAEGQKKSDKFLKDAIAAAASESSFKMQLTALGLTEAEFKADILERALVEEVVNREVGPQVELNPAEVRKYYDGHPEKFEQAEQVKFQHIHVSTINPRTGREMDEADKKTRRELIDRVLIRAKAGESFTALVKEVSDDVRTRDRDGEYTVSKGTMPPAFAGVEAAAFSLLTGEISQVIVSPAGYHIVKQLEHTSARQIPFSEVEERIRSALKQVEIQKQLPEYFERLKKEAGVVFTDAAPKEKP